MRKTLVAAILLSGTLTLNGCCTVFCFVPGFHSAPHEQKAQSSNSKAKKPKPKKAEKNGNQE